MRGVAADGTTQDLRARTRAYASAVIKLYSSLPKNRTEVQIIDKQLIRSGTAVAAIYREASRARSDAEFISKIETSVQEADESDLWLDLLETDCGIRSEFLSGLRDETNQLISILVSVAKNVKIRMKDKGGRMKGEISE